MVNQSSVKQNGVPVLPPLRPRIPTYRSFRYLVRRLGNTATNTAANVREFLGREIPMPTANQLLGISPQAREQTASEANTAIDRLKTIVTKSHEILVSTSTVFPITLFPDTITIDRTKITIIKRDFFFMEHVISIRIEDVLNVTVNTGPFFGSIRIASRIMNSTDHFELNFFWRSDAVFLSQIIQGYMIAQHNNLDTSQLSREELLSTLKELGGSASHR